MAPERAWHRRAVDFALAARGWVNPKKLGIRQSSIFFCGCVGNAGVHMMTFTGIGVCWGYFALRVARHGHLQCMLIDKWIYSLPEECHNSDGSGCPTNTQEIAFGCTRIQRWSWIWLLAVDASFFEQFLWEKAARFFTKISRCHSSGMRPMQSVHIGFVEYGHPKSSATSTVVAVYHCIHCTYFVVLDMPGWQGCAHAHMLLSNKIAHLIATRTVLACGKVVLPNICFYLG